MEMSDERGCLHPQELPGQGTAAVPGRIPGSIRSSEPRRWWGPPNSPCARGQAGSSQPAPAWM